MIINTSQGDVEVIGDVKEFKTSIDPKNLEYITTLLSSNLYSDPEQSFIRETVSNAWDSHVEAGNTDTPVIIKFNTDNFTKSITIRDYGTGLSPERFQEIWCNIGSSTKRDSNDFIGGFGIGRFSALACSNTVYITSYYKGIAYHYIMLKSGNSITTNLLSEIPTTEKDGVEITIRNIKDFNPYDTALNYIIFFPNIYIIGRNESINSIKIKRFNNYAACNTCIDHKLLLGNVLYPCNNKLLSSAAQNFLSSIRNTGITIKFNIGELEVTPNRENIIYTQSTINKICERIEEAKKELYSKISSKLSKDYKDIIEYYNATGNYITYDPISNEIITVNTPYRYYLYRESFDAIAIKGVTYKGKDLLSFRPKIGRILSLSIPKFKGVISDDRIYTAKLPYNISSRKNIITPKILMCSTPTRLLDSIKQFIKINYPEYTIIEKSSKEEFKEYIKAELSARGELYLGDTKYIVDEVYDNLIGRAVEIDFNTNSEYLKFKDELKSNKSTVKIDTKKVILYIYNSCGYRIKHEYSTLESAVKYIKGYHKGVIISNIDDNIEFWLAVAKMKDYICITANKETVSRLKSLNLKCAVDMGWILREDPMINKVYTARKYITNYNSFIELKELLSYTADESTLGKFDELYYYNSVPYEYAKYCLEHGKIDPYIESIGEMLLEYRDKTLEILDLIKENPTASKDFITAAIVKTKAYRVSYSAYRSYKSNKLIKLLCQRK